MFDFIFSSVFYINVVFCDKAYLLNVRNLFLEGVKFTFYLHPLNVKQDCKRNIKKINKLKTLYSSSLTNKRNA